MRLFLALELSSTTAAEVERAVAPLRELEGALSWVSPDKRHLTLRFLGEQPVEAVDEIVRAADAAAAMLRPFSMTLGGFGAFPNFRRARVVWLGVEQEPRLELLHHDLELTLERAGHELEGRPFRPHVTLARVRTPLPVERARALARAARRISFTATQQVSAITLFESALAPSGSHYRRVHSAPLGGR